MPVPRKRDAGELAWTDPDDAPELTGVFFERADIYEGGQPVRRGRPKLEKPKRQVTMRLDAEVVERPRANAALAEWLARNGSGRAGA